MAQNTYQLQHTYPLPPDKIWPYLCNMEQFTAVHPVVYKAVQSGPDGQFTFHEKLFLGPIPIAFTYPVMHHVNTETQTVSMKALVMGLVNINIVFSLSESHGNTTMHETITIQSVLPVAGVLSKLMLKAHSEMHQNIAKAVN